MNINIIFVKVNGNDSREGLIGVAPSDHKPVRVFPGKEKVVPAMKERAKKLKRGYARAKLLEGGMRLLVSVFLAGVIITSSVSFSTAQESVALTATEKEWLAAHPEISLAPDPAFHPVEYYDEKGVYRGIAADYVALLEKKLGIRFRIVRFRDWDEVLEKARSRDVDVFAAAVETPQRKEYMRFSRPYLEFPAVIIVKSDVAGELTLKKLRGMKVAVVSGYAAHDFLKLKHPELALDVVPDIQAGLRKVSFGMVDAFVGNLATASFYLEKEGIMNLRIAGESGYVYRLAFASRRDWPVLHGIMEKGLASIGREEGEDIYGKWIRLRPESLLAKRRFWLTVLGVFGTAMLGMAGVMAWNRSLKSQVAQRTEKLRETTVLLENIIANIPLYVFWKDKDSRYLGCNQRFASVAGVGRREDVVGKSDYDLAWRREEAEIIRQSDRQVMEKREQLLDMEETQRQSDGQEAVFLTSKVPLENEPGDIIGALGICSDITLRKRDEAALKESERRLSTLMANLPGMAYRCRNDRQWTMEFVSEGCYPLTGYLPEDVIGNKKVAYAEIIHAEDREKVQQQVQAALVKKEPFQIEYRIRTMGGDERWVWEQGRGVYGGDGELLALEGLVTDITERKETEERLREVLLTERRQDDEKRPS